MGKLTVSMPTLNDELFNYQRVIKKIQQTHKFSRASICLCRAYNGRKAIWCGSFHASRWISGPQRHALSLDMYMYMYMYTLCILYIYIQYTIYLYDSVHTDACRSPKKRGGPVASLFAASCKKRASEYLESILILIYIYIYIYIFYLNVYIYIYM